MNVRYKLYDYDNKTPHFGVVNYVRFDQVIEPFASDAMGTEAFSYKRQYTDADLSYRVAPFTAVRVGYSREGDRRTFRQFENTTDNIFKVALDTTGWQFATLRVQYDYAKRTGTRLEEEVFDAENEGFAEARQFDISDRNRKRGTFLATFTPNDRISVDAQVGIFREGDLALTGEELARMDAHGLAAVVDQVSVYARVSPMDKLKIVKAWKEKGHVVAMTGDGVNDAPALKHADIGVAMGISGTDVAKEAADIVLADDNFATIVKAIERGRWIYDNIQKYLTYLLRANITEVVVLGGVVMYLGPAFLPLLPAAILYINLASDGLPALALGISPPDKDIMQRPPRDPNESVFSFDVRTLILLGALIECPIFLWVFFQHVGAIEVARTEVFLMFVIIELIVAMNFRSLRYSIFEALPHKWLLVAIGWELALIAVLVQFESVREAFGINMPTWGEVGFVVAVGLGVMATIETAKVMLRRRTSALVAAPMGA